MNPIEKEPFSVPDKKQIIQQFNELRSKEKLITATQKVHAMFIRVEALLKRHPVRISLMTFVGAIFLFAFFQNEFTRGLALASFGTIFIALTYKLGQANYHKNLFDDRFALFNVIDEVMRAWASDNKATREMVSKLNTIMRKSHCLFSEQTYLFIKKFRMAIIILAYCIESAPDREEVIEARKFLVSLVDNENLPKMFPELRIDSY